MLGIEQMEPGIGRRAALPKISLACNTLAITGQDKPINTMILRGIFNANWR